MQIQFAFFKSKVAKRIFSLFLIAAIIPVALTGYISYKYVTTSLSDQKKQHLSASSKAYGMSIFDRLIVAESQLISLKNILLESNSLNHAMGSEVLSIDSTKAPLFKNIKLYLKPIEYNSNNLKHLLNGKSAITPIQNNNSIDIVFTRLLKAKESTFILSATADSSYIYGDMDIFAGDTDACVVAKNAGALNCSDKSLKIISLPSFDKYRNSRNDADTIQINNTDYLVASWELFLNGSFNTDSWFIHYTVPSKIIFSPIKSFLSTLVPLLLLTILIVSFLSINQISRILVPLEKLKLATKSIARREFSNKIALDSNDEFQQLGDSFNQMSSEIADQFTIMSAMANLDQAILTTMDRDKVVEAIFRNLNDFIKYDYAGLLILDKNKPHSADLYKYVVNNVKDGSHIDVKLLEDDLISILNDRSTNVRTVDKSKLDNISWLDDIKSPYITIIAVNQKDKLLGVIVIGHEFLPRLSKESLEQLEKYTDRINVALQAIKREEELVKQANFDELTKLPNRQLLVRDFNKFTQDAQIEDNNIAVLFIDLDKFKVINDSQGHATGDKLLIESGKRINSCLQNLGSVYRYGGDEFIVLLPFVKDNNLISDIAYEIIEVLSEIFTISSYEQFIGASIGIATYPKDGSNWNEVLQKSDIAMYKAKQKGRGRYMFFSDAMQDDILEKASLEADLFHAIEHDELYLVYQPQIDISTGEISGAETLMRWKHDKKGSIRPDKFIAYAEENGFIVQLGAWGMRQAIKQCEIWQIESQALPKIAINISPRQLRHENFIADVEELIEQFDIGATALEFEITESLFISDDKNILNRLDKLNKLGINIAIDDFGKGYSSLSYLKKLPVQTLKIDKLFIDDICEDKDSIEIVKAIIAMAKSLDKIVIAEGVETIEQLNILKDLGCDRAQGYFISKPKNAEEFVGYTKTEIIQLDEIRSRFKIV